MNVFGSFLVLAAEWEAETPGKQNLISKLQARQKLPTPRSMKLVIKVHELCRPFCKALVDGMDAGNNRGIYAEIASHAGRPVSIRVCYANTEPTAIAHVRPETFSYRP